jgi:hypothetical protein
MITQPGLSAVIPVIVSSGILSRLALNVNTLSRLAGLEYAEEASRSAGPPGPTSRVFARVVGVRAKRPGRLPARRIVTSATRLTARPRTRAEGGTLHR